MLRGEGHEIQAQQQFVAHLLALVQRDAIPFVDGQQQRAGRRPAGPGPAPSILLGDALVRIQHQHHHMRGGNGLQGARDAGTLHRILDPGLAAHAGGIDQREAPAFAFEGTKMESRVVPGTSVAMTRSSPTSRLISVGLAHVRPADHRDADGIVVATRLFIRPGLDAGERALQQLLAALGR